MYKTHKPISIDFLYTRELRNDWSYRVTKFGTHDDLKAPHYILGWTRRLATANRSRVSIRSRRCKYFPDV